ncbi:hypothetical protein OROGR_012408 [Orobanche gracilis]
MHDFCFTIPYGILLVCGGVIGYAKKGSAASLAGGLGTGLPLILAGYLSLHAYHRHKHSYFAWVLQLGRTMSILTYGGNYLFESIDVGLISYRHAVAAILTFVMGQRYMQTGKIMPAGVVAGISVVMAVFYLYKIATGGNHIPTKTE